MLGQFGESIRNAHTNANIAAATVGQFREQELRIAATPLLAANVLCHELPRFLAAEPDVSCRIMTGEESTIIDYVTAREADIGMGAFGPLPRTSRLGQEKFVEDALAVFARPGHRLFDKVDVTVDDLASEKWIVQRQPAMVRGQVETVMRRANIQSIDVACETDMLMLTVDMVRESDFIAVLPQYPIMQRVAVGDVARVPIEFGDTDRTISFVYRGSARAGPVLTAFIRHMRNHLNGWRDAVAAV